MNAKVRLANQHIDQGMTVKDAAAKAGIDIQTTEYKDAYGFPVVRIEDEYYRMIDDEGGVCGFDQLIFLEVPGRGSELRRGGRP